MTISLGVQFLLLKLDHAHHRYDIVPGSLRSVKPGWQRVSSIGGDEGHRRIFDRPSHFRGAPKYACLAGFNGPEIASHDHHVAVGQRDSSPKPGVSLHDEPLRGLWQNRPVELTIQDVRLRRAAFDQVTRLAAPRNGILDAADLAIGFKFEGQRIPLINSRRGIFKPRERAWLLPGTNGGSS